MNHEKRLLPIIILGAIFLITIVALKFIELSNDHTHCETITEEYVDENGVSIKNEKHVCKERFSI